MGDKSPAEDGSELSYLLSAIGPQGTQSVRDSQQPLVFRRLLHPVFT